MRVSFESPGYLWLLLLCLPATLWMARGARGGRPTRRYLAAVLRCLSLLLLLLALARPQLMRPGQELAILLLVDRSGSVARIPADQVMARVAELLADRPPRTRVGLILFGKEPILAIPPRRDLTPAQVARALERPVDGSETDLEAALRLAQLSFPPGVERRIVLFSDGNQTRGDARTLIGQLATDRLPVSVYPLRAEDRRLVVIDPIRLSTRQAFLGESVELSVLLRASRPVSGTLQIEVTHSRPESLRRRVDLRPGKNGPFRFTLTTHQKGPHQLKAHFTPRPVPGLALRAAASRTAFLSVSSDRPRVLLVEGTEGKERYLVAALEAERIDVEARPVDGIPTALWDLARYDCLILSDVPATRVTTAQMRLIRHYVEQRAGAFVMVGGADSFGRGGWYRTPIADILPVRIEIPQRLEMPSLAIVLAIDKSGSMSGKKIALARDAASAVVELLSRKDWLGVVAFDSESEWSVPLQRVARPAAIVAEIGKIRPGGGTYFYPALQAAYRALLKVKAKLKHVILLSDGHTNAADYRGLVTRMALERITVSTVAVGDAADVTLMQRIAGWGRGRYYFTRSERSIPQIFTQETIKVSRSSLKEVPFRPVVHQEHQVVRGIDFHTSPYLQGYVVTRARPTAEVPLVYRTDPILALWRVGLGQVAAFTSDAKDRWASMWLEWEGFPKLWGQLIRQLIEKKRRVGQGTGPLLSVSGQLQVVVRGRAIELTADLVDPGGRFVNDRRVTASLTRQVAGTGEPPPGTQVTLRQVAPGRYRGVARPLGPGTYLARVRAAGTDLLESADFEIPPAGELLTAATLDREMLGAIASGTGGAMEPGAASVHRWREPPRDRPRDLWPWLILLAALLLPLDLAFRRILLDPGR